MPNVFPGAKNAVLGTQSLESWDHAEAHNEMEDKIGITSDPNTASLDNLLKNHTHAGGAAGTQIGTAGIGTGAVTTAQIAGLTILGTNIAADAISATKILDQSVNNTKLRWSQEYSVIGKTAAGTGQPADITAADNTVLRRSGTSLSFGQLQEAAILNDAVSNLKLRNSAALSVIGNPTNVATDPSDIVGATAGHVLQVGSGGTSLVFGPVSATSIGTASIQFSQIQNVTASNRLLGRVAGTPGPIQELTMGTGFSVSGTTITVTGGGGGGVTDHGALDAPSLADNDHPQYLLVGATGATSYRNPRAVPIVQWGRSGALVGQTPDLVETNVPQRFYVRGTGGYTITAVVFACYTKGIGNNRVNVLRNSITHDAVWDGVSTGCIMTTANRPNLNDVFVSTCTSFVAGSNLVVSGDYLVLQYGALTGLIADVNVTVWAEWTSP